MQWNYSAGLCTETRYPRIPSSNAGCCLRFWHWRDANAKDHCGKRDNPGIH